MMHNSYQESSGRQDKRSDPQGYQQRGRSERELSAVQNERKPHQTVGPSSLRDSRPPLNDDKRRQEPEKREKIYNSFTETYHAPASAEKRDPPPLSKEEQYRQRFRQVEQQSDPPRTRRVIFSRQLEIHGKQEPQPPGTPTIPILRSRLRERKATPYKADREDPSNARDPTPRSNEKTSKATDFREPAGKTAHLVSFDPPLDRSKEPLFSPAANPRKGIRSTVELRERNTRRQASRDDLELNVNRRSIKPVPVATIRSMQPVPVEPPPQTPQSWNVADLFPNNNDNPSPRRMYARNENVSRDSTLTSYASLPSQQAQPLRAFAPRTDHWDAPDLYPDKWQHVLNSPSTASSESQSAYLINKYSNSTGPPAQEMPRRDAYPAPIVGDGEIALFRVPTSPTKNPNQGDAFRSKENQNITSSARKRQHGYSQLDEEEESNYGTELILVPRVPQQIHINGNSGASSRGSLTPRSKRTALGGFLRRPVVGSSPKVPFQELPVVAMSFDENFGLKQSTDDTGDSDSGMFFNPKPSKWDAFEHNSRTGDPDNDFLIPASEAKARKKWTLVLMLVLLVIFCLSIGLPIYFKMTNESESGVVQMVENSECAIGNSEDKVLSERYTMIRKYLIVSMSDVEVSKIDEAGTAQRKALCWIADFDKRQAGINKGNITALVQRYTLGVIYYSLVKEADKDPLGLSRTDFLSSSHECEWGVIMCGIPETITALLLADKSLSGMLPAEVGNLVDLSFLELSLNKLTGSIPTSVGKLTMLEYFAIAFNSLTGSLPSELGEMTKLEFVNMRSSQIHGNIPSELGRLTRLETLLLEGNWLSGTIPSSLGNLHKVQQMSFRKNHLSGRVGNELCELREEELLELKVDSWIECECCTSG